LISKKYGLALSKITNQKADLYILHSIKGRLTMQRNANIEQTSEINKDFFVISQRVKQIFAVYCKYAKNSKKVFCRFYRFICKNALFTGTVFCMCYIQQSTEHLSEGI